MHKFTFPVLAFSLALLTGCDPQGPAADVGDHIDEVVETGFASDASPTLPAEARPEPEVIEQQKKRHEQVVQQASKEAEEKLDEILQNTQPQP
ncbi:hypothetical protein GU3_07640 [Oceanimonas sp. GK1]|uniref:hypothetical protein n=1 Tax=Oceanimonas sp. (strain GK1 / IBRC-M 10197) TaxID=511062 RepID=UPI0002494F78|nr:hypothetical protein [Oceanimonas sp. GK1]AEY01284.1 hypothetical protein GU3_07640 [Oceanimonas sp. GK1]